MDIQWVEHEDQTVWWAYGNIGVGLDCYPQSRLRYFITELRLNNISIHYCILTLEEIILSSKELSWDEKFELAKKLDFTLSRKSAMDSSRDYLGKTTPSFKKTQIRVTRQKWSRWDYVLVALFVSLPKPPCFSKRKERTKEKKKCTKFYKYIISTL